MQKWNKLGKPDAQYQQDAIPIKRARKKVDAFKAGPHTRGGDDTCFTFKAATHHMLYALMLSLCIW